MANTRHKALVSKMVATVGTSSSNSSSNIPKIIAACQTDIDNTAITKSSINGLSISDHLPALGSTVIAKNFYTGISGEAFELFSSYDVVIAQMSNGENDNTMAVINLDYSDDDGYGFQVYSVDNANYPDVGGENGYVWDSQIINLTFIGYNNVI